MVITWNTKKVAGGYEWRVYTVGYQVKSITLKSGIRPTRAQAEGRAQKWMLYLSHQQKTGNLDIAA